MKVPNPEDTHTNSDVSFVMSASSKKQVKLLEQSYFTNDVLHVEGPHLLWLQKLPLFYYSLRLLPAVTDDVPKDEDDIDGK